MPVIVSFDGKVGIRCRRALPIGPFHLRKHDCSLSSSAAAVVVALVVTARKMYVRYYKPHVVPMSRYYNNGVTSYDTMIFINIIIVNGYYHYYHLYH